MVSRNDEAVEVVLDAPDDHHAQEEQSCRTAGAETSTSAQCQDEVFPERRAPTSRRRLYLMVLADFGLSFTWLSKFAVATPYFQHTLKAGPFLSHLVWIMGPLSGLIVAPVVGVLSDRCTWRFGRRRPFILGGMIACIFGMNVFANARDLTFGYLPAARWLAFLAFGILDFSTNAIMFPSRALMGDLLPADEQHAVQSAAAVVASIAEICAAAYLYSWTNPVTHVSQVFIVASVMLAITCSVSLYVCHEQPLQPGNVVSPGEGGDITAERLVDPKDDREDETSGSSEYADDEELGKRTQVAQGNTEEQQKGVEAERHGDDETDEDVENRLSSASAQDPEVREANTESNSWAHKAELAGMTVWRELVVTLRSAIANFPRPLIRVGIVYGLAWFAWFASLPFYSQWIGVDVLGGDPHAAEGTKEALQYERGVSVFSIANVSKALIAIVFSAYYPRIIKWVGNIGERVVFGVSFLVFAVVLYTSAYTKNVAVAIFVIALGSVPFIVTQTIPIAIVVQRFPENLASNLGVLNLFCVIPQLIDTIYTGKVAEIAGESAVLRVASIWAFAAGLTAVCFL